MLTPLESRCRRWNCCDGRFGFFNVDLGLEVSLPSVKAPLITDSEVKKPYVGWHFASIGGHDRLLFLRDRVGASGEG